MNEAQAKVLTIRAHVELTFQDDFMTMPALAEMARVHGMLTNLALDLADWSKPQELPEPQPQPKQTKVKAAKPRPKKQARADKATEPRFALSRQVECPLCHALPGEDCMKMTLGKNSKPTNVKIAGGLTHGARVRWYREWKARREAAKQPEPPVAEAYGVRAPEPSEQSEQPGDMRITLEDDDTLGVTYV